MPLNALFMLCYVMYRICSLHFMKIISGNMFFLICCKHKFLIHQNIRNIKLLCFTVSILNTDLSLID